MAYSVLINFANLFLISFNLYILEIIQRKKAKRSKAPTSRPGTQPPTAINSDVI